MGYSRSTKSLSSKNPTTPDWVQAPGTVANYGGGFSYEVDQWTQLDRFLLIGTEGNSFTVSEQKLSVDNAKNVIACIKADGARVVSRTVEISEAGRAKSNRSAEFVLALCLSEGDLATKNLASNAVSKVCRIGTHLFELAQYVDTFRGWGSCIRRTFQNWYNGMDAEKLAYQAVKYPGRVTEEGVSTSRWTHRDLLRKCHANTKDSAHKAIYDWICHEGKLPSPVPASLKMLKGANLMKAATSVSEVVELINEYNLPHETVPKEFANSKEVWEALLPNLPMAALVRSLNRLTAYGVLVPLGANLRTAIEKLTNEDQIRKSRIHPLTAYMALRTYAVGHGDKGSLSWTPIPAVSAALETMFYASFKNVEPTGKNIYLALDVSGSMGSEVPGLNVSSREIVAIMAMILVRTEKNYHIAGFSHVLTPLHITPNMSLAEVVRVVNDANFGSTYCGLPMVDAKNKKMDVDAFVIYTDNDTNSGSIQPSQALRDYRKAMNKPRAKLIVAATYASPFSIADPKDRGMLDVVGFDSGAPALIADFIRND